MIPIVKLFGLKIQTVLNKYYTPDNPPIVSEKIKYCSFVDAKNFVNLLSLKSKKEWSDYCKSGIKPNIIPNNPKQIYENDGWVSWGDFLNGHNRK